MVGMSSDEIEVSGLNRTVKGVGRYDDEIDRRKRRRLKEASESLEEYIKQQSEEWEKVGLSERESTVAAYRELGFTNRTIAYFLGLSPSTVNEYQKRIEDKIDAARSLVSQADSSSVMSVDEKYMECKKCGHRTQRSKADIVWDTTEKEATIRCNGCSKAPDEKHERTS